MDNVILVDCDGVLVNWAHSFDMWMKRHGYEKVIHGEYKIDKTYGIEKTKSKELTKMFNESGDIGWIPPLRDAIKYVKKLHEEHGYVFHCITSLSKEPYAYELRKKNLENLFGNTAFEKLVCLDTGADKDEALEEYRDSGLFWVEDKIENVDVGISMGLQGILIGHDYNTDYKGSAVRVQNWKEIYKIITGESI